MNVIQKIELWGDAHHAKWLTVVVLSLLILFWVVGSGTFSVDQQLNKKHWR